MGKKKSENLNTGPKLEPPSAEEVVTEDLPEETEQVQPPKEVSTSTAAIEVPLRGDHVKAFGHVDVQLDRMQATVLRRLQDGLDDQNKRLANGRGVFTRADVVRWLLEEIGNSGMEES